MMKKSFRIIANWILSVPPLLLGIWIGSSFLVLDVFLGLAIGGSAVACSFTAFKLVNSALNNNAYRHKLRNGGIIGGIASILILVSWIVFNNYTGTSGHLLKTDDFLINVAFGFIVLFPSCFWLGWGITKLFIRQEK